MILALGSKEPGSVTLKMRALREEAKTDPEKAKIQVMSFKE